MGKEQYNKETDYFSRLVRDKLEGHELPVDDRCWLEIDERLNRKRRTAFPLWAWVSGAAVSAAAVALLFLLPPLDPADGTHELTASAVPEQTEAPQAGTLPAHTATEVSRAAAVLPPSAFQATADNLLAKSTTAPQELAPSEESAPSDRDAEEAKAEPAVAAQTPRSSIEPYADLPANDRQAPPLPVKKSRRNNWLVAAAVSTGGQSFSEQKDLLSFAPRTSSYLESPDGSNETTGQTAPLQSFSKVTHLPPISAGLRVRKDFGKHFAIESGLTYTYLHSNFNDDQIIRREASLRMHYLGVPLNAVVYIANRPKWNVYFLAGGMVEKGLQASYKETIRMPGAPPEVLDEKGRIAGVQWSLNASVGIAYQFYKDFSIYFEPNIAYYLQNNQPMSARTENPLIVGLNAGIRYRIK